MTNRIEVTKLQEHLNIESSKETRNSDFDMNDLPDMTHFSDFQKLKEAIVYLQENLFPIWQVADRKAMLHQSRHMLLAKITILAGTCAVLFAIIQMAVVQHIPAFVEIGLFLEIISVVAGIIAVSVGLRTKGDKKWLCERNRAERLRMLKFKSLGWGFLWNDNLTEWQKTMDTKLENLKNPQSIEQMRQWTALDKTRLRKKYNALNSEELTLSALSLYYGIKRLNFQASYFNSTYKRLRKASLPWRNLSLPVFIISTIFVLIHFISGWFISSAEVSSNHDALNIWMGIEIWSLALAAIIPVAGLGSRVWLGAFEPHRSANLYECKHNTVLEIYNNMTLENSEFETLSNSIIRAETLFENEHREWLRLMLETEWML